jgi:peptide/nickel transport system substrate-binding protein
MNKKLLLALLVLLMGLSTSIVVAQDGELPRNETLYVAGYQWQIPVTFNPLAGTPDWPAPSGNIHELVYETLFAYNIVSGSPDPLLAKDLTAPDSTTMDFTLQDGTHWQDGQALTPDDVIYSFGLYKTHSDLRYSTLWNYITDLTATGDRTLQLKLNPDNLNAGIVKDFLGKIAIVPQHIWADREAGATNIKEIVDTEPVGSGPYTIKSFSEQSVILQRDDNYWGIPVFGTPAPTYIVHPIFKDNDAGNLALQNGEIDVSQEFAPEIWKMWQDLNLPVGTWFKEAPYHLPGNIPLLHINTHKPGLDNVLVRRALAYSIDYAHIAATAMSSFSIPVKSSLIIPSGGEEKFFDADQVAQLGWEYNPDKAKDILENQLKAVKGDDGVYVLPDGTRLGPWTIQATFGWTDWDAAVTLAAQNATDAGFDVSVEQPEFPVINANRNNGDFDMLIWTVTGVGAASPWQRFRDVLDIRGVPDVGQQAFWNFGRFSNPDVAALLDQAAAATDEATQKDLYAQLDKIFMDNIPAIPLMYRPLEFFEYNESVWTGFPNADNPVSPPQQWQAGIQLLYHIKLKG